MAKASRFLAAILTLLLGASSGAAMACPGQGTVWDLTLGAGAAELPYAFIDYACGTNGGPPSTRLAGFSEYHRCEADERSLYEVYFRYDDEQEFIARALEQQRRIEMCEGTRVHDVPVVASALFDRRGILSGIRLVSDARGAEPAQRNDHWALGSMLRRQFGGAWNCSPTALSRGSTPASAFMANQQCVLSTETAEMTIRQEYFHRIGQSFRDEFGDVQPGLFVSGTYFEMIRNLDATAE